MLKGVLLLFGMLLLIGPDLYQSWQLKRIREVKVILGLTLMAWLLGLVLIFRLAEPLVDELFALIPERW